MIATSKKYMVNSFRKQDISRFLGKQSDGFLYPWETRNFLGNLGSFKKCCSDISRKPLPNIWIIGMY